MDAKTGCDPSAQLIESTGAEDMRPYDAFNGRRSLARKIMTMTCCIVPAFLQTPEVIESSPAPRIFKDARLAVREQ